MKISFFFLFILFIAAGCSNFLTYRSDLDEKASSYYSSAIDFEKNLQKRNIEGIQTNCANAQELCRVLYDRMGLRDQHAILGIAIKLHRASKTLQTFEEMRLASYDLARLMFSREDLVAKPLQIGFDLEMLEMQELLLTLIETRANVVYLDRFRMKSLLFGKRQEENLDFDTGFKREQEFLREAMFQKLPAHLTNVGIAITKDSNFKYALSNSKYNDVDLTNENNLLPNSKTAAERYYYYFADEKYLFQYYMAGLKGSLERLKKAVQDFQQYKAKDAGNEVNSPAYHLTQITASMEKKLTKVEQLFDISLNELKQFAGKEIVDSTVLAQNKQAESEEASKKSNTDYYFQQVQTLAAYLADVVYLEKQESESALFLKSLAEQNKDFNQSQGSWTTGYAFLDAQWKDKTDFGKVSGEFEKILKRIADLSKESLVPLYKTHQFYYESQPENRNQIIPFILENGYLKENKK